MKKQPTKTPLKGANKTKVEQPPTKGKESENTGNKYPELKEYEEQMRTALYSDYAVGLSIAGAKRIFTLYEKITGVKPMGTTSCGQCQLDILKRLGALYYGE